MFFVFAVISAGIAFSRARATGCNGYLWAFIAAVVFVGTGLSFTFGFSLFLEVGREFWNWSEGVIENYSIIGAILSVIASFGTTWLILRKFNKVPEKTFTEPPLPPIFERKD